jgi:hypothetical protein
VGAPNILSVLANIGARTPSPSPENEEFVDENGKAEDEDDDELALFLFEEAFGRPLGEDGASVRNSITASSTRQSHISRNCLAVSSFVFVASIKLLIEAIREELLILTRQNRSIKN